jgi:hypothetical protein
MQNVSWSQPVNVAGNMIRGPLDAHNFLMFGWPHVKNLDWSAAENCALAALDGRATAAESREKFEAALKSAQLN